MAKKSVKTNNVWVDVGIMVGQVVLEKVIDYYLDSKRKWEKKNG